MLIGQVNIVHSKMLVRAGSIRELCNFNQSVKPALHEANFHSVFKAFRLLLCWRVLLGQETLEFVIGTRPFGIRIDKGLKADC